MKKLNSSGFSHDVLAVFIVLIVAVIGVGYLVASHADQLPVTVSDSQNVNLKIKPEGTFNLKGARAFAAYDSNNQMLYVADPNNGGAIDVYNDSNPISPVYLSSYPSTNNWGPSYEYIRGDYLYVVSQGQESCNQSHVCSNVGNYFQIFSINPSTDSQALTSDAIIQTSGGQPDFVNVSGDTAYVSDWSGSAVDVINVKNKTNPNIISTISIKSPGDIEQYDKYVYIVSYSNSLNTYDVSNPSKPVLVSSNTTIPAPGTITLSNNGYLYLNSSSSGSYTMQVLSLISPSNPEVIGSFALPQNAGPTPGVTVGSNLYFTNINYLHFNFYSYNVSNPANPVELQTFPLNNPGQSVLKVKDVIYVLENSQTNGTTAQIQFFK